MTDKENPPIIDQDYLDATEDFGTDVDEAVEFDVDNEDGIFAPSDLTQKKKKSSKLTAVAVVMVALLSGAAFYYFNQGSNAPVAPVENPVENVDAAISQPAPAEQSAVGQAGVVPGVPAPVSDFSEPAEAESTTEATSEVAEQSENPPVAPDAPTSPEDGATTPVPTDIPAEPAVNAAISPDQSSPVPEAEIPVAEEGAAVKPEPIASDETAATPPDLSTLVPAPVKETEKKATPAKKNELEAARETINVAESPEAKTVKTEYFDSPNGKVLKDMPPPSINPMSEPGESIIIVHKGKATPENVIVEKGDDSGFIESRLVSASRAAKLGRNDAALDFYNELYRKNPNDPRILMGRAVTYQKLGETQKAIEGYQDVLNVEPNNPEAITNLMGLIGQTKPAFALQNLLDLRQKFPRNSSVAAQLGVAYAQSGNAQDGLKYLNIAAQLQPENPLHYYNMAVISEKLNDREKAISYYEQALDAYSVNGSGTDTNFSREQIYDRLARLRGN